LRPAIIYPPALERDAFKQGTRSAGCGENTFQLRSLVAPKAASATSANRFMVIDR
jgi:hypothetical protein